MTDSTNDLLKTIRSALDEVMAYVETASINYGDIDEQTPKAINALTQIEQHIYDLESVYREVWLRDMHFQILGEMVLADNEHKWLSFQETLKRLQHNEGVEE